MADETTNRKNGKRASLLVFAAVLAMGGWARQPEGSTEGGAAPQPATQAATQAATQPASTRPVYPIAEKWHGTFKGTVELLRPGKTPAGAGGAAAGTSVMMELIVTPLPDKPGSVGWTIVYGEGEKRQARPYELNPVPGFKDRFVMDEKNGIFIDHALVGDVLVSQFRVGPTLLLSRFEMVAEGVLVEISSFQTQPSRKSKPDGMDLDVESYPATTVQRGLLRRQ